MSTATEAKTGSGELYHTMANEMFRCTQVNLERAEEFRPFSESNLVKIILDEEYWATEAESCVRRIANMGPDDRAQLCKRMRKYLMQFQIGSILACGLADLGLGLDVYEITDLPEATLTGMLHSPHLLIVLRNIDKLPEKRHYVKRIIVERSIHMAPRECVIAAREALEHHSSVEFQQTIALNNRACRYNKHGSNDRQLSIIPLLLKLMSTTLFVRTICNYGEEVISALHEYMAQFTFEQYMAYTPELLQSAGLDAPRIAMEMQAINDRISDDIILNMLYMYAEDDQSAIDHIDRILCHERCRVRIMRFINLSANSQYTPLTTAIRHGNIRAINLFLFSLNADPFRADGTELTPHQTLMLSDHPNDVMREIYGMLRSAREYFKQSMVSDPSHRGVGSYERSSQLLDTASQPYISAVDEPSPPQPSVTSLSDVQIANELMKSAQLVAQFMQLPQCIKELERLAQQSHSNATGIGDSPEFAEILAPFNNLLADCVSEACPSAIKHVLDTTALSTREHDRFMLFSYRNCMNPARLGVKIAIGNETLTAIDVTDADEDRFQRLEIIKRLVCPAV
jgi:hypothetical protein